MTTPHTLLAGRRILLADLGGRRSPVIRLELIRLRCQLLDAIDGLAEPDALAKALERLQPDLLLVDGPSLQPAWLDILAAAQQRKPRAILILADEASPAAMQAALQAGVSGLGLAVQMPQGLGPWLQWTFIRFEHEQSLRLALHQTQTQLAERKQIERARGILMREHGLHEDEAFQRLRQLAMDGGQTLAAVAQRLIDADQLLRPRTGHDAPN